MRDANKIDQSSSLSTVNSNLAEEHVQRVLFIQVKQEKHVSIRY
jgi:hypothetical protein